MSDIRNHAVAATAVLHLRDAADELMYADGDKNAPMTVTLHSPGSKAYAKANAAQQNRLLEKMRRKGKIEQTAEQKQAEQAEFLTECTVAFENVEYDGKTGAALAMAVYSDSTIGFIADQVAKYLSDWSNFKKPSTTSSL